MEIKTKVIVLTPVRNEGWILYQFLLTASLFADHIVISDQFSTDNSREIVAKFPKAYLINNAGAEYDEASRQLTLIATARKLYPDSKNIFLCLDADEIFSANSLASVADWETIKNLKHGATIYFEKPDMLYGMGNCVRWKSNYFPIGYVDDGKPHTPSAIHSKRMPDNPEGEKVFVHNIKIMHFAHSRKKVQSAKLRLYSVLENIKQTKRFYTRRYAYPSFYNELKTYPQENIEKIPAEWLVGWTEQGIKFSEFADPDYSWHDYEVLKYFKKYGYKKFHLDNIWDFDWEKVRRKAISEGKDAPIQPVKMPSILLSLFLKLIDKSFSIYRGIRN